MVLVRSMTVHTSLDFRVGILLWCMTWPNLVLAHTISRKCDSCAITAITGSPRAGAANHETSGGGDGGARKEDDDDGCESDGSSCCSGSSSSEESGDDMSVCGPVGAGSDDDDEALMVALAKSLGDGAGGGDAKKNKKKSKGKSKWASKTDKLDLAGLLNVLDGVVDTPNRIVIMTTNHPEVTVGVEELIPQKATPTRPVGLVCVYVHGYYYIRLHCEAAVPTMCASPLSTPITPTSARKQAPKSPL